MAASCHLPLKASSDQLQQPTAVFNWVSISGYHNIILVDVIKYTSRCYKMKSSKECSLQQQVQIIQMNPNDYMHKLLRWLFQPPGTDVFPREVLLGPELCLS